VREILLNNFFWKLTAFLLAVLAWLGFQPKDKRLNLFPDTLRTQYSRYLVAHPVTITKPATDRRDFRVTPSFVDITLSGDEKLGEIDLSEFRATVDVAGFKEGSNSLPLRFVPPEGAKIQSFRLQPEKVRVEVIDDSARVPSSRGYE
jgi:YbbR domain-containing protein